MSFDGFSDAEYARLETEWSDRDERGEFDDMHEALVNAGTRDRDTIPDDEPTDPDPETGSTFWGH